MASGRRYLWDCKFRGAAATPLPRAQRGAHKSPSRIWYFVLPRRYGDPVAAGAGPSASAISHRTVVVSQSVLVMDPHKGASTCRRRPGSGSSRADADASRKALSDDHVAVGIGTAIARARRGHAPARSDESPLAG